MASLPPNPRKTSLNLEYAQRLIPTLPISKETCTLTIPGQAPVELPLFESNDNVKFVDIRSPNQEPLR